MNTIEQLYQSLDQRRRPEDVAEMIVELMRGQLAIHELASKQFKGRSFMDTLQHLPTQ
ncbi:hypothetical protein [Chryseobacterium sp. c4a]|uniref:hypothetical protein n=1 Tax=Chryseobacterium sp. c4a TaxID=1573582 RepID=UPI00135BEA24|nr:hypothetical protein [Chryseobacterium sp. c4a]